MVQWRYCNRQANLARNELEILYRVDINEFIGFLCRSGNVSGDLVSAEMSGNPPIEDGCMSQNPLVEGAGHGSARRVC